MTNSLSRALAAMCLFISILFSNAGIAADKNQFAQGKKHFENQKFQLAADVFQSMIDLGDQRAVVYYNLGVSEYKLGQYDLAEQHFKKSASDHGFSDLAAYNIGLINTKLDRYDLAKKWFKKIQKNPNRELYKRARNMVIKIEDADKTASILDGAKALAMLTLGSDSNVNRVTDNSPTNIKDNFYTTYLSGSIPISTSADSLFVGASRYAIKHSDSSTNDFSIIRANIGYKKKINGWKTKSIFSYASSNLGGSAYQDSLRLGINARLRLAKGSLIKVSYKYDDIKSSDTINAHLNGWRQQIRLSYKIRLSSIKIETRYKLELNDRTDKLKESYSPTRHTMRGIATKHITNQWAIGADIGYRTGDYPDVSSFPGRTEDRLLTKLFAQYKLNNDWLIETKFQNTSNDSDDPAFKYDRNEFLINTAYTF